jgi:hypothetical protein
MRITGDRPRFYAVPGIDWHIIQRGNNRSPCIYSDLSDVSLLEGRGGRGGRPIKDREPWSVPSFRPEQQNLCVIDSFVLTPLC